MDSVRGRLAGLVGRGVSLALVDGARLDDCRLVSQPCARWVGTAWIVHGGDDVFVPVDAIADVWEAGGPRSRGGVTARLCRCHVRAVGRADATPALV